MSVRGTLPKLAVIATLAATAALATPTAAMAYGWHWHHQPLPSTASELSTGNAAVGLVGPRVNWLTAAEETHG
ncbi:hypothetical protein ACWGB8_11030 [Kitasatospora sp. NPDC054939]